MVDDEMGYRLEVKVPVDESMDLKTDPAAERSTRSLAKYEKALMGVSIIFGLSGIFFWWKGKRIYSKMTFGQ